MDFPGYNRSVSTFEFDLIGRVDSALSVEDVERAARERGANVVTLHSKLGTGNKTVGTQIRDGYYVLFRAREEGVIPKEAPEFVRYAFGKSLNQIVNPSRKTEGEEG